MPMNYQGNINDHESETAEQIQSAVAFRLYRVYHDTSTDQKINMYISSGRNMGWLEIASCNIAIR